MDLSAIHERALALDVEETQRREAARALPVLLSLTPHAFVVFRKVKAPICNRQHIRIRMALWSQQTDRGPF
jgi:hypothetical protein